MFTIYKAKGKKMNEENAWYSEKQDTNINISCTDLELKKYYYYYYYFFFILIK